MIPKSKVKLMLKLFLIFVLISFSILLFGLYFFLHKDSFKKTKATNNEGLSINLQLSKQSVKKGEEVTVLISGSSSAQIRVIGYLGELAFDKSKLQVKDIQYKLGVVSKDLGDDNLIIASVNGSGKIALQGEIQSAQGHVFVGNTDIASVTFVASEEAKPQFLFSNIKFYRINADNTLTELLSDNVDSNNQTNAISLKMKLKLQGFVSKPNAPKNISVKVKLGGGAGSVTAYQTALFSSGQDGIWTGTVDFASASAGTNYYLLVKGGKHVQRKICDSVPVETEAKPYHCSEGKINLIVGENNIDLTGILQFAGDLNLETGQDGGVNAADFSLINKAINARTPIDAATIERGDVNIDGVVDSQDFSLLNKTMELGMNRDE